MSAAPDRSVSVRRRLGAPSLVLFLCLFASQATLLVLSPILAAVAADLGVSTATAGQLRAVSGAVGALTALTLAPWVRGRRLRDAILAGLALLGIGSAGSAAAPSFALLLAAQVPVGVGLALVLAAGLAAANEWDPPGRSRVLSWALVGQPAAWVIGMPITGVVAEWSWRATWLVLPFSASVLAFALVALRPRGEVDGGACAIPAPLWRHPGVPGWALGETLAYSAWAGTLVYAGALFVESYAASTSAVGLLLAVAALAYVPGNFLARRWTDRSSRALLTALPLALAVGVVAFGAVRPGVVTSALLLAAMAFVAGARTILGTAFGLDLVPDSRLGTMGIRTAAAQGGYLVGGGLGGLALATGGYALLGGAFAVLHVLAAAPHLLAVARVGTPTAGAAPSWPQPPSRLR